MYTAEEKQQIAQLEAMGCYTMSQTTIKEVVGGFMIEHQVTYVHDTEVKGVTRQQMVATDSSAVIRTVHDLYGGPITDNIPASKAEAYVTEDVAARAGKAYPYKGPPLGAQDEPTKQYPGEALMEQARQGLNRV